MTHDNPTVLTLEQLTECVLWYASAGFSVVPLCQPDPGGTGCKQHSPTCQSPGKRPVGAWSKLQTRAPSAEEIVALIYEVGGVPNIGIATGRVSGCDVLDADSPEAELLVQEHLGGLRVPAARTGGGNMHYYFTPAGGLKNRVRVGGVKLDIRTDGGLIVVPPSLHASGATYQWIVPPFRPLPAMPPTLLKVLQQRPTQRRTSPCSPAMPAPATTRCRTTPYGRRALHRASLAVMSTEVGERNDTLFKNAASIFELVAGGELDGHEAFQALADAARIAGLDGGEVAATLLSAQSRGVTQPRRAPTPLRRWEEHLV
jgi:hypothetical protein